MRTLRHEVCFEFFRTVIKKESLNADVHVLSYCWCDDLIRSTLSSGGLNGLKMHANELKFGDSGCTGEIVRKVESPIDKVQVFGKIIESYGKGKKVLSVYIGDSFKDLLCLLEADIGIVVDPHISGWSESAMDRAVVYCRIKNFRRHIFCSFTPWRRYMHHSHILISNSCITKSGNNNLTIMVSQNMTGLDVQMNYLQRMQEPLNVYLPLVSNGLSPVLKGIVLTTDGHTFPWNNFLVVWVYDGVDRDDQVPAIQRSETHGVASQCLYNTNLLSGDQVIPIPGKYFMRFLLDYERNICRDDTWILVVAFLREGNLCAFLPTWLDIYGQNLFYRHLFAAHDMQ
nr:probable aminopyrimidine aminohydrolase, mitochondrial isoform X2 [Ipomoea trifida]